MKTQNKWLVGALFTATLVGSSVGWAGENDKLYEVMDSAHVFFNDMNPDATAKEATATKGQRLETSKLGLTSKTKEMASSEKVQRLEVSKTELASQVRTLSSDQQAKLAAEVRDIKAMVAPDVAIKLDIVAVGKVAADSRILSADVVTRDAKPDIATLTSKLMVASEAIKLTNDVARKSIAVGELSPISAKEINLKKEEMSKVAEDTLKKQVAEKELVNIETKPKDQMLVN